MLPIGIFMVVLTSGECAGRIEKQMPVFFMVEHCNAEPWCARHWSDESGFPQPMATEVVGLNLRRLSAIKAMAD
jgi:hypothetical protein